MTAYLQKFVEGTATMPAELQRCMTRMRELDDQVVGLQQGIDAAVRQKVEKAAEKVRTAAAHRSKRNKSAPPGALPIRMDDKMAEDSRTVLALAEEKVKLAQYIYNYVDQRICTLDRDLRSFDNELARERSKLGLPPDESAVERLTTRRGRGGAGGSGKSKTGKRKRGPGDAADAATLKSGLAVSPLLPSPALGAALPPFNGTNAGGATAPDEPTYCYCNRVSFGEMIACDNSDCPIEWFHLQCVGIDPAKQPKGKWYCKECAELKRAGKLPP